MACGAGLGNVTLPGDPSNDSILSAVSAFGGIDVSWTYPGINPYGVAHTILYRSTSGAEGAEAFFRTVNSDHYFDRSTVEVDLTYYYWIRHISVNGTEGDLIGPVSAVAKPPLDDYIAMLSGEITESNLASNLLTRLGQIDLLNLDLASEIQNRINGESLLGTELETLQNTIDGVGTSLTDEINTRQTEYSAMIQTINNLSVSSDSGYATLDARIDLLADENVAQGNSITSLDAAVFHEVTGLAQTYAKITAEELARADADTALSQSITDLDATITHPTSGLPAAHSSISTEQTARADADTALSNTIDALDAVVTHPTTGLVAAHAGITNEETARINADGVLTSSIDTLRAEVEDGVTGLPGAFAAVQTEETARISGDAALTNSYNTMLSTINDPDTGLSAAHAAILSEESTRASADSALSSSISTIQASIDNPTTGLSAAHSAIQTEETARINGDDTLSSQITTLESVVENPTTGLAATLAAAQNAQATADGKINSYFQTQPPVGAGVGDIWFDDNNNAFRWTGSGWLDVSDERIVTALSNAATAQATADGKVVTFYQNTTPTAEGDGDLWIHTGEDDQLYIWDEVSTTWIQLDLATIPAVQAQIQTNNTTMIGYCEIGGDPDSNYQTPASCQAAGGTWLTSAPLAESVKSVSVTTSQGTSTIQQLFSAYGDDLEAINAEYTVKIDANGYVSGFGITSDGATSLATFNVDTFSIGRLDSGNVQPFIVTDGSVFLNDAYINQLTIDKLISTDFSLVFNNGRLQADYIEVENIVAESAQSPGFISGDTGYYLDQSGNAEFNSITIYDGNGEIAFQSGSTHIPDFSQVSIRSLTTNPSMDMVSLDGTPAGYIRNWDISSRKVRYFDAEKTILEAYDDNNGSPGICTSAFNVTPGATYKIKLRAKLKNTNSGIPGLYTAFYAIHHDLPLGTKYIMGGLANDTGEYAARDSWNALTPNVIHPINSTDWSDIEVSITIPKNTQLKAGSVAVYLDGANSNQPLLIDMLDVYDVSWEESGDLAKKDQIDNETYIANGVIGTLKLEENTVITILDEEVSSDFTASSSGWADVVSINIPPAMVALDEPMPYMLVPYGSIVGLRADYNVDSVIQLRIVSRVQGGFSFGTIYTSPLYRLHYNFVFTNDFRETLIKNVTVDSLVSGGHYGNGRTMQWRNTPYWHREHQADLSWLVGQVITVPGEHEELKLQVRAITGEIVNGSGVYAYQNCTVKAGAGLTIIGMQR